MAAGFGGYILPTFEDSGLLRILLQRGMLKEDSHVLDVGCGAGKYALAMAGKCERVLGLDLSPKMIHLARKRARDEGITNVDFHCVDWHDIDLKFSDFEAAFDLVIAHMTPAVQSADTFQKLSLASRGWCLMSKPTRRSDPVSDKVKKLVGIEEKEGGSDEDIVHAFKILWHQGYHPYFDYEKQQWNMKKTLDEACTLYINRVKTYGEVSLEEEGRIKKYLRSIAVGGFIYEDVDTIITTISWQVRKALKGGNLG
ncbi:MAG: class I SAM-dependent methyltransferase [Clostridia bacterium]|nr:class I SAM-dependent methyltransferase [Clostridia bacterium]